MERRPPISSLQQELPFRDPAFSWQTFEKFFCDFLNARPIISIVVGGDEVRGEIIRARPFGRPGDAQEGIDILAEMQGGEIWDFQCKRVKVWTPADTQHAIGAYERDATQRFILVTCEVSEECHRVIAKHPGWVLWDGREITRRFRELGGSKGASILFTHFGPGWDTAFFGITGSSPLIGAEAKFQQELREGRRFHHRHALIGRAILLEQLDEFAEDEKARVFLLIGRGGLGKSRLLLEWSRTFQHKHPRQILRFVFDKNVDFGPALQAVTEPLILVFDDAHRLNEVRRALFPELATRQDVKLVLSLRPGPKEQMMQELLGAGFDTTQIVDTEPMKRLTGEQSMQLVDVALKPGFYHLRHFLRAASRDCPLIAVIGAELINSGVLVESDLRETADVRTRVFQSLLDDASSVRAEFGSQETDDFLRLLALVGPVKADAAFFENAASFLGISSVDRATRLRDALDAAGLLLTTGAGTRVTPDLLSDYLAYDACYDGSGQSRTFAERLLASFSAAAFPKLMQHLAEAEWQALSKNRGAASVVEPLWVWFRERFEQSSFYERGKQLQEWGNISHLQPERTLVLAELALSLTSAPASVEEWQEANRWNTHSYSLKSLPKMLGPVAEHHPEFVARCLDILWTLGKDDTTTDFNNKQNHPFSVIHEIMTFKHWKRLDVHRAALDWLQQLFSGDKWLQCRTKPNVLFERFFQPVFATSIDLSWSSGRTFHMGSTPLHLKNSDTIRERVRRLCQGILSRKDAKLAYQLIPTLERGCDVARMGMGGVVSDDFCAAWDFERIKCLSIFQEMSRSFPEPIIHFQIRRALLQDLRYGKDSPVYRDACREVVNSLSNTLDFHIARLVLGNAYDEFERSSEEENWHAQMEAEWEALNHKVAEELYLAFPSGKWFDHLSELYDRWSLVNKYTPNFRRILHHIAECHPTEGITIAKMLLASPNETLVDLFDTIVMAATKDNPRRRLDLIFAAAESQSERLNAAAVGCCSWWLPERELPRAAWEILEALAPRAGALVAESITNFLWWNKKNATIRDWNLLAALPFARDQISLAANIAARAEDLVVERHIQPHVDSVTPFIARFECLKQVDEYQSERVYEKLAEAFPVAIFLMLWRRNQARKGGNHSFNLPYDFAKIPFRKIMDAPEVLAIVTELEGRALAGEQFDFDDVRLLRRAIQSQENPSAWLESAVHRATTEEHLELLRKLGSGGELENAAINYPDFAKALLVRAKEVSPACHAEIFHDLLRVGGGRGTTDNEPDTKWKKLLEIIDGRAMQFAADLELDPLFSTIVKNERSWMERGRNREPEDDEE